MAQNQSWLSNPAPVRTFSIIADLLAKKRNGPHCRKSAIPCLLSSKMLTFKRLPHTLEKLFSMQAADMFRIRNTDDFKAFNQIHTALREGTTEIEVGPKGTLVRNGIPLWVVKRIMSSPVA